MGTKLGGCGCGIFRNRIVHGLLLLCAWEMDPWTEIATNLAALEGLFGASFFAFLIRQLDLVVGAGFNL